MNWRGEGSKAVVALCEALSWQLPGGIEGNHGEASVRVGGRETNLNLGPPEYELEILSP
jgi:hypothetical protein